MGKQQRRATPKYSRLEKRAEAEIDRFLKGISPESPASLLSELKKLA